MAGIIIFYSPPLSFSTGAGSSPGKALDDPAQQTEVITGPKGEKLISMDLQDAPLKQILKIFSQQAGLNFVASENIQDKKVTLLLDKVTVEDAINTILGANGFILEKQPATNIYMIKNSGVSAIALQTKIYKLCYATVSGVSASEGSVNTAGIEKVIQNILSPNGKLIVDSRTNSLLVTDTPSSLTQVEEVLKELDVKTLQVMISAEILEVSVDTLKRLGVEWGDSTGQLMTYTGGTRSTFFPFKKSLFSDATAVASTKGTVNFNSFAAVIRAIKTDSSTNFLAKPRLLTLNNKTAEMKITKNAAVATTTITISQGGSPQTTTALERYEVGTTLKVTPHINKDDYITLTIEPEVSRVVASSFGAGNFDPLKRTSKTSIMVKDGETIAIAGLISREDEDSNRKVPILGDIPFFGKAFESNRKTRSDSEILVFITTKIIKEDGAALANVMQQELNINNTELGPREGGMIAQEPMDKRKKELLKEDTKSFHTLIREQDSPMSGKEMLIEKEVLKIKSHGVVAAN